MCSGTFMHCFMIHFLIQSSMDPFTCGLQIKGMKLVLRVLEGHCMVGLIAQQPHSCSLQQIIYLHTSCSSTASTRTNITKCTLGLLHAAAGCASHILATFLKRVGTTRSNNAQRTCSHSRFLLFIPGTVCSSEFAHICMLAAAKPKPRMLSGQVPCRALHNAGSSRQHEKQQWQQI